MSPPPCTIAQTTDAYTTDVKRYRIPAARKLCNWMVYNLKGLYSINVEVEHQSNYIYNHMADSALCATTTRPNIHATQDMTAHLFETPFGRPYRTADSLIQLDVHRTDCKMSSRNTRCKATVESCVRSLFAEGDLRQAQLWHNGSGVLVLSHPSD